MPGNSIKNKPKYKALKRKGMSKTRAAKISNAGRKASVKGGKKAGAKSRSRKASSPKRATRRSTRSKRATAGRKGGKK